MIKNNNFCKVWLLVIGMMVGNVMSLYGAEFNVTTFLSSQDSPSLREINQFSNNLEQLNDECKADQLQSCITLNTIVKSQLFIDRCKAIFRINDINLAKAKTKLADTCFFISENSKIISQEEKKPIVNLIKPHLSGVTALPLAIGENQPSLWDRNTIYKKAEFSINAIKELGKIITDHKMGEAEARSELLTKNLLGYLTYIDSFFKEEKNLASKSLIGSDIERNKNFLITLVKITANNETVNDAYNTLTKYVPSLPSLEELLPKPVMLQASPAQPIFRQDEVAILDEAIKNPKNDNESLILKTFKKIIKIIQDPNPNTWELKNEFETISFDFLWKNVRIDDQIIQIIKKLLDHETFKNVYNKITDNNHKQIIDKSISKIKSFLNSLSDISAQNQQPQTPTFQPIVSQFPTIAAAAAFQGLPPQTNTYQSKQSPIFPPSQQTVFQSAHQQLASTTHQSQQTPALPPQSSQEPSDLQQQFIQNPMLFNEAEIEALYNIRTSNLLDGSTVKAIDALLNINKFFYAGKQVVHLHSLWIPSVITLAQYNAGQLKPYIEKIVRTPDFDTIKLLIMQQPVFAEKEAFINACTQLNKLLSAPLPTNQMPVQTNTLLTDPLSGRKNIPNFLAKRETLNQNLNVLNDQIKAFPDKKSASQNLYINTIINSILSDQDTVDSMSPIHFFKFSRLLNYLGKKTLIPKFTITPIYHGLLTADDLKKIQPPQNSLALANVRNINKFFTNGCLGIKSFTDNVIQLANSSERYHPDGILENYINKIANDDFFRIICLFIMNGYDYSGKQDFVEACKKLNPALVPKQAAVQQPHIGTVKLHPGPMMQALAEANQPVNLPTPIVQQTVNQQSVAPAQPPAIIVQPVVQQTGAPVQQQATPNETPGGSWLASIGSGLRAIGSGIAWLFSPIRNLISYLFNR